MAGYDRKKVFLSHDAKGLVQFQLEIDISGSGNWHAFTTLEVLAGQESEYQFPTGFEAYWVRMMANQDCVTTAEFVYE